MTWDEFFSLVDRLREEVESGAHPYKDSEVQVWSSDPNDDADYELVEVRPNMRMGCGCWDGIVLTIMRSSSDENTD